MNEHIADPANALRIETVGWFVEHDGVRVAEQHPRQAKSLTHAQRVRADPPAADRLETDEVEDLVDSRSRYSVRRGQPSQMVAAAATRMHVSGIEQRTDLVQR